MSYDCNQQVFWGKSDEANLCTLKNLLIASMKGVEYDVASDNISNIQDRLFNTFFLLKAYNSLVLRKSGELGVSEEDENPRISALVRNVEYEVIWDKVYGLDVTSGPVSKEGSLLTIKNLTIKSVKDLWFDVFLENHHAVEARLIETLRNTHRWRGICPENAQPIVTYKEWQARKIHELELSSLGENDLQLRAFIDSL
jgi:hypothetical protein